MCNFCENQVKHIVSDSDLPYLPFKLVKWYCCIQGCRNHKKVKDYGLSPYYFDPVKRKRTKYGWRGGWFAATTDNYFCSKHYHVLKNKTLSGYFSLNRDPDYLLSKIQP